MTEQNGTASTGREKPQWVTDYEWACWQVWSPEDFLKIAARRHELGYTLKLDCDTMTITGKGPTDAMWHWISERTGTIDFLDLWIEWGDDTPFLDWLMGHLWCIFDMPREMPPFPEEFFEGPKRAEAIEEKTSGSVS